MQIVYTTEALFPVLSRLLLGIDFLDERYLHDPSGDLVLDNDDNSAVDAGDIGEEVDDVDVPAYALFDEARFDYEERLLKEYITQFEVLIFPILKDKALRDEFQRHCKKLGIDVSHYLKKNRKTVLTLAPTPPIPK